MKLTKKDKEQIERWVAALRSGEFKQGKLELCDASENYCCLGVAASQYLSLTEIQGIGYPQRDMQIPLWLKKIDRDFAGKSGWSLSFINDLGIRTETGEIERYNFDEIADLIELVYIHEAL